LDFTILQKAQRKLNCLQKLISFKTCKLSLSLHFGHLFQNGSSKSLIIYHRQNSTRARQRSSSWLLLRTSWPAKQINDWNSRSWTRHL